MTERRDLELINRWRGRIKKTLIGELRRHKNSPETSILPPKESFTHLKIFVSTIT
jgi:hypothetical protein